MDHALSLQPGVFFSQMGYLLGGLFLLLQGAAILYTNADWWGRGERVVGVICGVRKRAPRQYHSVYQYLLPYGELAEATSVEGGSSLKGRETGRHVDIRILAGQPGETREAPGLLSWGLAVGLFLSGAWITYHAETYHKWSPVTWILLAMVAAFVGRRLLKGMQSKVAAAEPWSSFPMESAETLGLVPEPRRVQVRSRNPGRSGVLLCFVGLVVLATATIPVRHLLQLQNGTRTQGTVFQLHSRWSHNEWVAYPEVQFTNTDGAVVSFVDLAGSHRLPYRAGDHVTVLYQPGRAGTAMIDHGLRNWEPVAALLILGGVLTGFGGFTLRSLFASGDPGKVGDPYDAYHGAQ